MLVDVLWANLAVFAVGQLIAVGYLRTGRFWLGMAATVALWATLDWWLVGRFVFAFDLSAQRLPVLGLQVTTLLVTVSWTWARLRRRAGRTARTERYRSGMQQLLTGDAAAAAQTFRTLTWTDPWDAAAWVGLGDALRRTGAARGARRAYRRAEAVDVGGALADLLGHRRAMLAVVPRSAPKAIPDGPAAGLDGGAQPPVANGGVKPGPKAATVPPAAARWRRKDAR